MKCVCLMLMWPHGRGTPCLWGVPCKITVRMPPQFIGSMPRLPVILGSICNHEGKAYHIRWHLGWSFKRGAARPSHATMVMVLVWVWVSTLGHRCAPILVHVCAEFCSGRVRVFFFKVFFISKIIFRIIFSSSSPKSQVWLWLWPWPISGKEEGWLPLIIWMTFKVLYIRLRFISRYGAGKLSMYQPNQWRTLCPGITRNPYLMSNSCWNDVIAASMVYRDVVKGDNWVTPLVTLNWHKRTLNIFSFQVPDASSSQILPLQTLLHKNFKCHYQLLMSNSLHR